MAKANKLIPVVDGTAGTPIELIDSRIDINNPTNGDVLMYNSLSGKFEANSIGAVVSDVAISGSYNDLTNTPIIDTNISETSTNPVQNKAIGVELRKLWDKKDIVSRLDNEYESHNNYIANASGKWVASSTYKHWIVPVDGIREVTIVANSSTAAYVAFLDTYTSTTGGTTPDYSEGWSNIIEVTVGTSSTFKVPDGAAYMFLNTGSGNAAKASHIYLTGIGITDEFELPSLDNNAGKVLSVNNSETDVEWVNQSSGGDAGVLYCTLTPSGSTYTCDTEVSDIVTAYQSGKVVLLKIKTDYRVFTCVHARTLSGTTTINACYTGGVTASNSGMTDASITLLRYVGSEWQLLNSWNIQQKLVGTQTTGQNLKTVNGNSLLGSGDLTIGGVTIYSGSTAPSSSTGSDGDIYIQTS